MGFQPLAQRRRLTSLL